MTQPTGPKLGVTAVMLPELSFEQQVALCQELGITRYTLRPRIISEAAREQAPSNWGNHVFDLTPKRLVREGAKLAEQLRAAGIEPFGTVPGAGAQQDEDVLKEHFEGAAAAGAGRVRVMPAHPRGEILDYPKVLDDVVRQMERASKLAEPFGIKCVMETHGGSIVCSPALAWNVVKHFDPARVGVIFDLPNFVREGAIAPHLAVSVLKDWIDHCHVGGSRWTQGGYDAHGFRTPQHLMCPMTESDLHLPSWLKALKEAGVDAPLVIEDYTPSIPGALRLRDTAEAVKRAVAAVWELSA